MMRLRISLILIFLVMVPAGTGLAQDQGPAGPVYIVQAGDTLSRIALQFGVPLDDLIAANELADPNRLQAGDRLVIPGLKGIEGVLTTSPVPFGENLRSLSRRHRIPLDLLAQMNRITSPAQLHVGSSLVLPVSEQEVPDPGRLLVSPGATLLELSAAENLNPWTLVLRNGLEGSGSALPGDVLLSPGSDQQGSAGLPPPIRGVTIEPIPLVQGQTAVIRLEAPAGVEITGSLTGADLRSGEKRVYPLNFFSPDEDHQVALQGVHAMAQPGFYPLEIRLAMGDGGEYAFSQQVPVVRGGYIFDLPLTVPAATLDPAVTVPEDELWGNLAAPATPARLWEGPFQSPSPADCTTSVFGSRRSYNGSPYVYFHTGVDFCGGTGVEILAPAPGEVVFAGPLEVRGGATVIDHGWGVYTAYMHQSEIFVEVGDQVEPGQEIGLVGATGRVTGAHLHWEIWVGSVQVEPVEWLEREFP